MYDPLNPTPEVPGMMQTMGVPAATSGPATTPLPTGVPPGIGARPSLGMMDRPDWRAQLGQWGMGGALGEFRDARQDWIQGGRQGERPRFINFLFPNGAPGGFGASPPTGMPAPAIGQPAIQPAPVAPLPTTPAVPQVGTGVGVPGVPVPTNPYGIPTYGG